MNRHTLSYDDLNDMQCLMVSRFPFLCHYAFALSGRGAHRAHELPMPKGDPVVDLCQQRHNTFTGGIHPSWLVGK